MTPHRLTQLSDGIFAISATLLILNFAVPIAGSDNAALAQRLIEQWPKGLAFLLSFGVVVNYWRLHSWLFRRVQVVDHRTDILNVLLLLTVAFMPYATNVAGTYPTLRAAAVLYSLTLLIAAIADAALSHHLIASNAYKGPIPQGARDANKLITFAVYIRIVGLAFAFFLPIVSYVIYWIVIIYYASLRGVDAYATDE